MLDYLNQTRPSHFQQTGYAVFGADDCPFVSDELIAIRGLAADDAERFVLVTTGDTDEAASVNVHRLLIDGDPPAATNEQRVEALLAIVAAPDKMAMYRDILGSGPLMVRRMQAHILTEGEFIGRHRDSESSDRYLAAVVVQLERAAAGGAFAIYPPGSDALLLSDFTVLVTDAELEHEVLPVTAGRRCTLAFWLARDDRD